MRSVVAILIAFFVIGFVVSHVDAATIYAQTGFNDQSGINSNPTPNNPYTIGQTVNGVSNSEPGWTSGWTTLDGGGQGGASNAIVTAAAAFEGDGGLSITPGGRGSTQVYRDFNARSDRFVVSTEVNFGSVGEFDGMVIQDNYPLGANVTGVAWRLTGSVGSRHFEVYNGTGNGLGTWVNTGIAQTPGSWQNAVADINVVTQQWTFSVDGVNYSQTLGFQGAPPVLNSIYEFATAAGSVDSITVSSTPEPSALAVVAATGGWTLLRRRRQSA